MLTGISASPGIAMGKVFLLDNEGLEIEKLRANDTAQEIENLKKAIEVSKKELEVVRKTTEEEMGTEKAQIFDAHLLLLADPEIEKQTVSTIEGQSVNAAWALNEVISQFVAVFETMDDEYMRERAADIKDVFSRVLRHLMGLKNMDLSLLDEEVILVAKDLTPSQAATMNKKFVLGFLTDIGGKTSHSAIMARTLEIPAVVGLQSISNEVKDNDFVIFDGNNGKVFVNPDENTIEEFKSAKAELEKKRAELEKLVGQESVTTDGHKVEIAGNIGTFHDLDSFENNDAEAVGLYRTEFLFMDRSTMPTEQEQYEAYSKIIDRLDGKNCIIRTLDIGGDKKLDYLDIGEEENPFLGYRAIRICLQDKEIFKPQLRALLRASNHGPLGIMFPMISSLEELLEAKEVLEECKKELKAEGKEYSDKIKVGMMIEVPSAAMMSDVLAKHVDFFSIGTNDLTQYSCAVDRMNEKIEKLYNPFHPGLLRLINTTIKNANENKILPAMCGSMAHIPELVPLFLGMGLIEFSMSPMHVLPTRKIIKKLSYKECQNVVEHVLSLGTANEVQKFLNNYLQSKEIV